MLSSVYSCGAATAKQWQPHETTLCRASNSLMVWVAHSDSLALENDARRLCGPDTSQVPAQKKQN